MTTGGRRPFGYRADRMHLERTEAFAILDATERILAGEPPADLAREWNERAIRTTGGGVWTATTLKRVLTSGRIAGWVERDGRLTERAGWPPIIELEQHIRLRAMFECPPGTARSYVLSGFLFCANCGKKMVARPLIQDGKKRRRYACVRDRGGCNRVGIAAEPVEDLVIDGLLTRAAGVGRRSRRPGAVAILEARLDELAAMLGRGKLTPAEWSVARAEVAGKLQDARSELAADAPPADRAGWDGRPFPAQRSLLAHAVGRIDVDPAGAGDSRFDPGRVHIGWKVSSTYN